MPAFTAPSSRNPGNTALDALEEVRELGRRGLLSAAVQSGDTMRRRRLIGAVYTMAVPVVFSRVTRKVEISRGHQSCATSVRHLSDECIDRFEDDMEAVIADVEQRASFPIRVLESWIASRVTRATIDGYRRRRGAIGALQRPRLPQWLIHELRGDRWLSELALKMLAWAGNPASAGVEVWPMASLLAHRAEFRDDNGGTGIRDDVSAVLAAMRTRPEWYARYVETPLDHKPAPVARLLHDERGNPLEHAAFSFVDRDEQDDAQLHVLAYQAFEAIRARTARGEPARQVVREVIVALFGGTTVGSCDERRLKALHEDPAELDRIAAAVLELIEEPDTLPS